MGDTPAAVQILTAEQCLQLLAEHHVHLGRIGLVTDGWPVILPVNYRLVNESIVLRTTHGMILDAALDNQRVVFEVDSVDPAWQEGWSVMVQGRAIAVEDAEHVERLRRLPLRSWAGEREHFVEILPSQITGRRLI